MTVRNFAVVVLIVGMVAGLLLLSSIRAAAAAVSYTAGRDILSLFIGGIAIRVAAMIAAALLWRRL